MQQAVRPPTTLETLRRAHGLTQHELAQRAGLSRETISRLERGATPQLRTAFAIAHALDRPIVDIFDTGQPAAA